MSNLIPDKGRLLQCASCDHKWFFKKEILKKNISSIVEDIDNNSVNISDQNTPSKNNEFIPSDLPKREAELDTDEKLVENIEINNEKGLKKKIDPSINKSTPINTKPKKQKNFKISNIFIVAFISFVAFIIVVDTFKYPIGKIVPNIEFLLYNLYESIKDISLFIRDLK